MSVDGIDVASYQSTEYPTAGLGFVFVKATEGTTYVNPKHAAQIAHGREHRLVIGHYHFARPGEVTKQADYFLRHAAPKAGDVLAFDWEDAGVRDEDKDAWIKHVRAKAPGHRVILYCNLDFWINRDTTSYAGDGLWVADPGRPAGHPRTVAPWRFHQYSSTGGVDHNVADFESTGTLRTWAANGTKPVPHAPRYEPYPGAQWFVPDRRSPVVAAMRQRLVTVGCARYRSSLNKDVIGPGDIASYEAWQRHYNTTHHKGWSGSALTWPPGRETWDALQVPHI